MANLPASWFLPKINAFLIKNRDKLIAVWEEALLSGEMDKKEGGAVVVNDPDLEEFECGFLPLAELEAEYRRLGGADDAKHFAEMISSNYAQGLVPVAVNYPAGKD